MISMQYINADTALLIGGGGGAPGVVVVDAAFIGLVATSGATAFLPQTFHSLHAKESHYKKQLQKKSWEMETMRQHMQQVRVMKCGYEV